MEKWLRFPIHVVNTKNMVAIYNLTAIVCPVCKTMASYESNFCPFCGERLLPSDTKEEEAQ